MNNSQVTHAWAHGHEGKGSNLYSDGKILTSYYTTIAFKEGDIAFISSNNMSNSTAKHIRLAFRAISGRCFATPAFHYGHGTPSVADCIGEAATATIEEFKTLCRARVRLEWRITAYENRRQEIMELAETFNITICEMPEALGDLKERAKELAEAEKQAFLIAQVKKVELEKQQRALDLKEFQTWIAKGTGRCPYSYQAERRTTGDYISLKDETVITSQGAEAPLSHVVKALAFYNSRRDENGNYNEWQTNGHKIHLGLFMLDTIDIQGNVKAGCHLFKAEEIARFRKQWSV